MSDSINSVVVYVMEWFNQFKAELLLGVQCSIFGIMQKKPANLHPDSRRRFFAARLVIDGIIEEYCYDSLLYGDIILEGSRFTTCGERIMNLKMDTNLK